MKSGSSAPAGAIPSCLLCGGLEHWPVFRELGIDILRCQRCGHVFSSFAADPHYDGFWGDEVEEGAHVYWSRARARMHGDFARRFLAGRSGRLLDMGCGLGFFLKAISPHARWEVYGCEISPAAVRHARDKLGLANVIQTRLEDADLPLRSFDIVTLWDVLEHVSRPDALLRRCHALLRDGGICFIRSPNVSVHLPRARVAQRVLGMRPGVGYLQPRHHAHHYSMSSLRALLVRNGFSVVEFVHLPPVQSAGLVGAAKRAWFQAVRAMSVVTGGRWNLDNLFAVAGKNASLFSVVDRKSFASL